MLTLIAEAAAAEPVPINPFFLIALVCFAAVGLISLTNKGRR